VYYERNKGEKMKLVAHIDKDRNHIVRSETGAVIAVLVDYPLCRDSIGKLIVDAVNNSNAPAHPRRNETQDQQ
jgi:hypothetical protein